MKTFREFLLENYAALYGFYNDSDKALHITRPNGQTFVVRSPILSNPSIRVFGVATVNDHIDVLIGPRGNPQPIEVISFSNSGIYIGKTLLS